MSKSFSSFLIERGIKPANVASALGLNRSTLTRWTRVPSERLIEVERITGIPREELRPDLAEIFLAQSSEVAQ